MALEGIGSLTRPLMGPRLQGMTRRRMAAALGNIGAATAIGTALACAPAPGGATPEGAQPAGKTTTVTFFSPASDKLGDEIMRDQANKFNASRKDIQIDYVFTATANNYANYTTAMVSGSAPDVIMTYSYTPVPQWHAKGLIQTLDPYRSEMKIKQADYFVNVWQMITFSGKLFGFLQEFDANLLGINAETVAKAGLDPNKPPKTIDELDNWNSRVVKKDGNMLTQVGVVPWLHGGYDLWAGLHGGGYWDSAAGKFTINRKENAASLAWMAKTAQLYGGYDAVSAMHQDQSLTVNASFYSARAALPAIGEYKPIQYQREQPDFKYTVAFWPAAPGVTYGLGQTGGGNVFVLPKEAPHPKEAVAVMKYFAGDEMVWDWNVRENNLPPVKSVAFDAKFREAVPLMAKWLDMLKVDKMKPVVASPLVSYFNSKRGEWATKVIKGEVSPQQALDELAKDVDFQVKQFEQTKTLP
ncbi:MAG: extracellular solute-binding protein [Chloroflexi bacterium]|nr:extracellular solute-binding protein [Chloroflexota bacterium]